MNLGTSFLAGVTIFFGIIIVNLLIRVFGTSPQQVKKAEEKTLVFDWLFKVASWLAFFYLIFLLFSSIKK